MKYDLDLVWNMKLANFQSTYRRTIWVAQADQRKYTHKGASKNHQLCSIRKLCLETNIGKRLYSCNGVIQRLYAFATTSRDP